MVQQGLFIFGVVGHCIGTLVTCHTLYFQFSQMATIHTYIPNPGNRHVQYICTYEYAYSLSFGIKEQYKLYRVEGANIFSLLSAQPAVVCVKSYKLQILDVLSRYARCMTSTSPLCYDLLRGCSTKYNYVWGCGGCWCVCVGGRGVCVCMIL
jgi:hypothetical protein